MVAYTMPQQRKKEERERPRVEKYNIKLIRLRFVRGQVLEFKKGRRRQYIP